MTTTLAAGATPGGGAKAVVIVPTRNRAELLGAALDSLLAQEPVPPVEIVVADNGSTDETAAVVRRAAAGCDRIRYLSVPEPGKVHALNAAIGATDADVCVFFDDDQVADPDWLRALLDALARHARAAAVGGRYEVWPADVGRYWKHVLLEPFAVDQGPVERPTTWLAGGNMAVRAKALREVGGFELEAERGEDVRLCLDLQRAGHELRYVPAAVVFHRLHDDRLTLRGWRRQSRQHAAAMALLVSPGTEAAAMREWRRARRREAARIPYAAALEGLRGVFHQLDWVLRYGAAIAALRARTGVR